ncbi:zinc finger BED domain-containing protein 5 [Trichonephila clavipes]|nr:zinc finger BED domain-containing protein 5 [Trichonephila clavipes]
MDIFLSHKRTFDGNKASTSPQTSIVSKIKSRKYPQEYLNFGLTITEPDVKQPHTIAEELILPAAIEIVEAMFGDNFAKELQSIPLSNDTVSRRIDDIAEDVEQQFFASYEWVRDPFKNTPEGLSTTEEEIFIDFTSSGEIKRQLCNKTLFHFWAEVDDESSELKTKAFRILLPFSTSYLCETGFSAVAALKTKYRSQLNIEKNSDCQFLILSLHLKTFALQARQSHGSH